MYKNDYNINIFSQDRVKFILNLKWIKKDINILHLKQRALIINIKKQLRVDIK